MTPELRWGGDEHENTGHTADNAAQGGRNDPDREPLDVMTGVERPTAVASLPAGQVEYRLDRRGDSIVVIFHGGHMRAGLALGEDVFAELGCTLLVPSRPGYGRTPLTTGTTPAGFADVVRELCEHLGIGRVAAVVGISGGGPTAVMMAARHSALVDRLILESAVGFLPWPDWRIHVGAHVLFNGWTERITWGGVRALLRVAPRRGLQLLLGSLSIDSGAEVVAALDQKDRDALLALFSRMRSGHGFSNDLRTTTRVPPDAQEAAAHAIQPALVIATGRDGQVPYAHAESLVANLPRAQLVTSEAETHFLWFGRDYPEIARRIRDFLKADV